ncbi:hypothetical protein MPSEU_000654800 [Mayamaea pseudoterrestris]|nr:hypothetical protein MPSEU_000654800 [Mayamaea pseudoterrestris]
MSIAFKSWRILLLLACWRQWKGFERFFHASAFSPSIPLLHRPHVSTLQKMVMPKPGSDEWNRDLQEVSQRRPGESGGGETFAGAVLGGLIGGPFGAIFGATIGSNIGARKARNQARESDMAKLGIDSDMLLAAQEVAEALERANEGLKTVQDSLFSLQRLAERLETDANALMGKAKVAMAIDEDEEKARKILLERQFTLEKLKTTLKDCVVMKSRLEVMERNVGVLERKAMDIETLLQRTVGAKAMQKVLTLEQLSLPDEDPLLRQFRDMGIE